MKPRTKLQVQVFALAQELPDITVKMLEWAKVGCLEHRGYATKSRVLCLDCGERFLPELVKRKRAVCPHCDQKLVVEESRKSTLKQKVFVAKSEVHGEFQVIRNFLVESNHGADKKGYYSCYEILQHWILPNGKREVVARNHTLNHYCDSWNGYLEIRNSGPRRYWESNVRYDVYPYKYHPDSAIKSEYQKYGINANLNGVSMFEAINTIPTNSMAETLLKAKQYGLLYEVVSKRTTLSNRWPSIRICMRNKYFVKDPGMWFDYLDLLRYFNKDLRNAHYVCPKNLKKEHDRLVLKKRIIQEKQALEQKKARAIEQEASFKELKEKFFGLSFTDGLILVKMLDSVQEYVEEGDAMHHCVFTNDYFTKPDSLVLSASIENERIETVEVSLKSMKVIQSRGKHNNNSEYHERILKLVNRRVKKLILERTKLNQSA